LLVKQLASASDSRERAALIQLLGSVGAGSGEIVAPLLEIVRSSRWFYNRLAEEMLRRTGPAGVPALSNALSDPDKRVRIAAARTLAHLGPAAAGAVPELMRLLGEPGGGSSAVTSALVAIGEPAIAPLGRAVQSTDRRLRHNAAGALSQTGARGVNALIDALSQDDPAIQKTALRALGGSGPAAVPALARRLPMELGGNRHAITEALGQMGPDAASGLPALRAARAQAHTDSDYHRRTRRLIDKTIARIEVP
jgi:HEAT repeat protein